MPDVERAGAGVGRDAHLSPHEEIRQLACRYAEAVDSRDTAALVALFVGAFWGRPEPASPSPGKDQ